MRLEWLLDMDLTSKNLSVYFVILCCALLLLSLPSIGYSSPPQPLQNVELKRYVGQWYDIAHYPNKYQDGCQDSTIRFSFREDGDIDVLNSCRDKQKGVLHHADGHGWVTDAPNNARLKVSYFWPFRKEYMIIDQGKDYDYSVICTPDRKNLWIIARTPNMSKEVYDKILLNLEKHEFNTDNIIKTEHTKFEWVSNEKQRKD
jgi:apolipoprotein D and lipocalin family protein